LTGPYQTARALCSALDARLRNSAPAQLPGPPIEWTERYAELARELGLPALTLQDARTYLQACWQEWRLGRIGQSDHQRT